MAIINKKVTTQSQTQFHVGTDGNLVMTATSSGNVGIGTDSPDHKLHVDVGAPGSADKTLAAFSSERTLRDIGFVWDDSASTLGVATLTNHALAFHTNGNSNERMRIDTSGNVGIGRPSPSAKLDVNGSMKVDNIQLVDSSLMGFGTVKSGGSVGHTASVDEGIFWHTDNGYGIYRTAGSWSGNYQQLKLKWITGIVIDGGSAYGASGVRFDNNGTQAMRLGTNGNLYVGADQQGADINDGRLFSFISSTNVPACRFAQGSTSTGIPVMRIRHENASNGNYIEFRTDENVLTGKIYDSSGTMQYTSQSDQRLKENVEPMTEGLTEVLAMNPVKYTLKDIVTENKTISMEGAENRGFLAQELNEQYPWAVEEGGEDPNMNPWGVDYGKLTPILVKAIQELSAKLEAAEERITELEG